MRAMEIKKYTGNRRRKRLRQMVILFLFLTVFLGGKRLWEEDLTEQAGYLTERSRETLPVLFQAAFRHYCPAGTSGEKEREENGETWWMGHSREYIRAGVRCDENLENAVLQVRAGGAVDNEWIVCERM